MLILADENMEGTIVRFLREQGHDVLWMAESGPGTSDDIVLSIALSQQRLVLTHDHDFGDLVFRDGQISAGIVLLRLHPAAGEQLLSTFMDAWSRIVAKTHGHFIVIARNKIRSRPLAKSRGN